MKLQVALITEFKSSEQSKAIRSADIALITELIRSMGMIKKAAAITNLESKLIDQKPAKAIGRVAQEVVEGKWDGEFVVDVYEVGAVVVFSPERE